MNKYFFCYLLNIIYVLGYFVYIMSIIRICNLSYNYYIFLNCNELLFLVLLFCICYIGYIFDMKGLGLKYYK